jgi:hypothetical protein
LKLTYVSYDGDPAVLARYDDGRILGFVRFDGGAEWTQVHSADLTNDGRVLDEAMFKKRFGGGLPAFPK